MNGIDLLLAAPSLPFPGARVGLLAHKASRLADGTHTARALAARGEWSLVRLFSPEHGFFGLGAAGEPIHSGLHPDLGLPIFSLYGQHRSPPPETLADLDLLVVDLQDLGVRCYTYASTLDLVLHACAQRHLPVLVLDRPTPLAGISDGPPLDPSLRSFVGQIDLPLVFGLGQAALSRHLAASLPALHNLPLHTLDATPEADRLPWHPPSPAIVSREAARLYPLTVWSEAIPHVGVDRGGPRSFQLWSMPDLPASILARELSLPGIGVEAGRDDAGWPALLFHVETPSELRPVSAALLLLTALSRHLGPDRLFKAPGARPHFFDQLMGNHAPRLALQLPLSPATGA